ncbi:MAG TPA: guanylate kinase [Chitinispirillaceae bacterium]|jgi:guanylate kinase|nr:guanylate kinase [Chitinispirillaceae bacterium]
MSEGKTGKIFVFSAPSGAGKTTILDYLRASIPDLVYSISATTRKPRKGEVDGLHYFFLSEQEFKSRIESGEFAEWALVHGNYYGTPRSFIDQVISSGKHIVMDIDVFGKKQFDRIYPEAVGILILPPSMEELEKRLRNRSSDDEETIRTRLKNAVTEIEFARSQGKYEYTIINDDLGRTKREVEELVRSLIGA